MQWWDWECQRVSKHFRLLVSSGRVMSLFQVVNHVSILKMDDRLRSAAATHLILQCCCKSNVFVCTRQNTPELTFTSRSCLGRSHLLSPSRITADWCWVTKWVHRLLSSFCFNACLPGAWPAKRCTTSAFNIFKMMIPAGCSRSRLELKHFLPPGPVEGRFFSRFWPTQCTQDTTPPPARWLPPCQETGPAESGPGVRPWPCWWKSGKAAQISADPRVLWAANSDACKQTCTRYTRNIMSSCPPVWKEAASWRQI